MRKPARYGVPLYRIAAGFRVSLRRPGGANAKGRFAEVQVIRFLREADRGVAVKELCRKHGARATVVRVGRWHTGGVGPSYQAF
jgi:putative transposase